MKITLKSIRPRHSVNSGLNDAKTPQVKILYDVTEAEITVLGKWKGETKTETLLVDDNLAEVLQKVKDLFKEWYGEENE